MSEASPLRRRHARAQLLFDDFRIVGRRDADAVRHAQHMPIDREAGHAERMAEYDVGGLAADARSSTSESMVFGTAPR